VETRLSVDWSAPWFEPWREIGEPVLAAWRDLPLHEALNACAPSPVRFVQQGEMADGEAYESFIFRTRRCPTRDNMHDFFNGLAWLKFPAQKARLNELQAAEIERAGIGAQRGAVRDAITVFDENGAFIDAPAAIQEALLERDWRRLFIDLRPLWNEVHVTIFGHAMLEKLLAPRKDLTAHVWAAPRTFTRDALAAKPFAPLPVMGIPGWQRESESFSFYDDPIVFRPRRSTL
jgi:hypothetical protein